MDRTGVGSGGRHGDGAVGTRCASTDVVRRRRKWIARSSRVPQLLPLLLLCLLAMTDCAGGASSVLWSPTRAPTSDITCWTCNSKANNEECNNWAPDLRCPINHTVCRTVHRFSVSQGLVSVEVSKRCVPPSACTPQHVGCSQDALTGQQECVSCCDFSYCNQEVPVNGSSALQLSSFSPASPASSAHAPRLATALLGLLWTVALWWTVGSLRGTTFKSWVL